MSTLEQDKANLRHFVEVGPTSLDNWDFNFLYT
jgi:hypothetical protein